MKHLIGVVGIFLCIAMFTFQAWADTSSDAEKLKEVEAFFQEEVSEEDYWRTDELLVSATGSQIPVRLAPSVASVITSAEIEAIGATTLSEILETVPGLHVSPSSTTAFTSIWSIRGIHTSVNPQTLLLINGIPLNDTNTIVVVALRHIECRWP